MTRPRPLVPRGDPADSVKVVGEFGVIARVLARAGHGPGRRGRARGRRRGRCGRPTAGSWRPSTCSSRAGTSGATGRRRRTSGTRRPRPTSPTSRPWARRRRRCWSAWPARPTTPTAWLEGVATGLAEECAPLGAAVVGGDMVASAADSASVVLSVTALGDLGGREPVLRSGARPGDVRRGGGPAGVGGVRAGRAPARASAARLAVVSAHRRPTPPYAAGPAAADAGRHRDVRRQRRPARRPGARGRRQPGGHRPRPGRAGAHLPGAGRARCSRSASALGADPLAWVLTGGRGPRAGGDVPAAGRLPEGWR